MSVKNRNGDNSVTYDDTFIDRDRAGGKEQSMTTNTEKTKLSKEAQELRREYNRRWRAEHPDACKKYHMAYWEKRAAGARKE